MTPKRSRRPRSIVTDASTATQTIAVARAAKGSFGVEIFMVSAELTMTADALSIGDGPNPPP